MGIYSGFFVWAKIFILTNFLQLLERSLIKCKGDVNAAKKLIDNEFTQEKAKENPTGESVSSTKKDDSVEKAESVGNFKSKLFENFNKKCLNNQGLSVFAKLTEKCSPVKRTFSESLNNSPVQKRKKLKKGTITVNELPSIIFIF